MGISVRSVASWRGSEIFFDFGAMLVLGEVVWDHEDEEGF
jgi:hypothetical protein